MGRLRAALPDNLMRNTYTKIPMLMGAEVQLFAGDADTVPAADWYFSPHQYEHQGEMFHCKPILTDDALNPSLSRDNPGSYCTLENSISILDLSMDVSFVNLKGDHLIAPSGKYQLNRHSRLLKGERTGKARLTFANLAQYFLGQKEILRALFDVNGINPRIIPRAYYGLPLAIICQTMRIPKEMLS